MLDRRSFGLRLLAGVGAVGLGAWWAYDRFWGQELRVTGLRVKEVPGERSRPARSQMPERYAQTLAAMVARLLPDEPDGVGAVKAGAWDYIQNELRHPELESNLRLLMRGAAQLDRVATAEAGQPFLRCTPEQQDRVITAMQAGAGALPLFFPTDFIDAMVAMTLEGFLCDPIHGGNKDGVGWDWIGYAMHPPRPGAACHAGAAVTP